MGADSYLQPAAEASRKVIDRFGHGKKLEVAYSNARAVHPFPTKWRLNAYSENSLPILNESGEIKTPKTPLAADDDLIEKLMNSNEPVTLLFTGPLSDLASALKKKPEIEDKISRTHVDGRNLPGTRQRCRTRLRRNAGMERFLGSRSRFSRFFKRHQNHDGRAQKHAQCSSHAGRAHVMGQRSPLPRHRFYR